MPRTWLSCAPPGPESAGLSLFPLELCSCPSCWARVRVWGEWRTLQASSFSWGFLPALILPRMQMKPQLLDASLSGCSGTQPRASSPRETGGLSCHLFPPRLVIFRQIHLAWMGVPPNGSCVLSLVLSIGMVSSGTAKGWSLVKG